MLDTLMSIDISNIHRLEIELKNGVFKSDDEANHRRLLETLEYLKGLD